MEEGMNQYKALITLEIAVPCSGMDLLDAEADAGMISESLADAIFEMNGVFEVNQIGVKVKEEEQ
jgi:hypothetical protein